MLRSVKKGANIGRALYFSRNLIASGEGTHYHHIGLYAYTRDCLNRFVDLPVNDLEVRERLEQLRALENGIPIRVIPVDYKGRTHWSVDNPEDIKIVEDIIAREGELL